MSKKMKSLGLPPFPQICSMVSQRSDDGSTHEWTTDGLRTRVGGSGAKGAGDVYIRRPDLGVRWTLLAGRMEYWEFGIPKDLVRDLAALDNGDYNWQAEGVELIHGVECTRFRGTFRTPSGDACKLTFIDLKTGVRHRQTTFNKLGLHGLTIELKSLSLDKPDPSVFELPPGYKKVAF